MTTRPGKTSTELALTLPLPQEFREVLDRVLKSKGQKVSLGSLMIAPLQRTVPSPTCSVRCPHPPAAYGVPPPMPCAHMLLMACLVS